MAEIPEHLTAMQVVSFAKYLKEQGVISDDGMTTARIMGISNRNKSWAGAKVGSLAQQYPDMYTAWATRERLLGEIK